MPEEMMMGGRLVPVEEIERYERALEFCRQLLDSHRHNCVTHSLWVLISGALRGLGEVQEFLAEIRRDCE